MAALLEHPEANISIGIENGMIWEDRNGMPVSPPGDSEEAGSSGSIFNVKLTDQANGCVTRTTSNNDDGIQLVDKACIALIFRDVSDVEGEIKVKKAKYYWSESLPIPPLVERPFNPGPNGEWSELKDPHDVLTHGKKNRAAFLYETIAKADPLEHVFHDH